MQVLELLEVQQVLDKDAKARALDCTNLAVEVQMLRKRQKDVRDYG